MRTMYRVEEKMYTDCEGRHADWQIMTGFMETIEEAKARTKEVTPNFPYTGDWRIVARTVDERAFTVTDNIVAEFDYFEEVEKYIYAEREAKRYTEEIAKLEASKVRCRTEKGIARKDKEITQYKKWLANVERILAEKKIKKGIDKFSPYMI